MGDAFSPGGSSSTSGSQNVANAFLANLFGTGAMMSGQGVSFTGDPFLNAGRMPELGVPYFGASGLTSTGLGGGIGMEWAGGAPYDAGGFSSLSPGAYGFGGGGWGGYGGGGVSGTGSANAVVGSSGTSFADKTFTDPVMQIIDPMGSLLLHKIFGLGGKKSKVAPQPAFGYAPRVFMPQDFGVLRNLLEPTAVNPLQAGAGGVGAQFADPFAQTQAMFRDVLMPGATELAQTGFRTDMQPIVEAERRRFQRETVPGLAEQYAGITGGFSSDFLNSITQAGSDMGTDLGALQSQLDEAASTRRMQGIPLAGQVGAAATAFPTAVASDILGLGNQLFQTATQTRPEYQLLAALGQLFGLAPSTTGSQSKASGPGVGGQLTGDLIDALGNIVGGYLGGG